MTGSCPLLWCAGPLAVYVLYKSSSKCNFILKIAYLYTTHMLMACVVSVLCLPRPRHPDNGLLAVKIMKPVNDLLGIQWTIEGLELLDTEESAVVVMNHQSSVDLLALFELWPHLKKVAPIAKKQILYAGPFGLACYLLGCVFIDRKSPTSREDVITAGVEAKSNGTKLLIFPEERKEGVEPTALQERSLPRGFGHQDANPTNCRFRVQFPGQSEDDFHSRPRNHQGSTQDRHLWLQQRKYQRPGRAH